MIEEPREDEEEQIVIRCRTMTPDLLRMVAQLKAQEALVAYSGNDIHRLNPSAVYYIESVDNKTFLYLKDKVYKSRQKLYELEEALATGDFLRASKSTIVNLAKIKSVSPALSGRFEAALENGEKVIISRQYTGDLKKRLGI